MSDIIDQRARDMARMALQQNTSVSKMSTASFTATVNNTSHITHNLVYNPTKDDLVVKYMGSDLSKINNEYTENADKISIDLVGWIINTGEIIEFKLYKNVK